MWVTVVENRLLGRCGSHGLLFGCLWLTSMVLSMIRVCHLAVLCKACLILALKSLRGLSSCGCKSLMLNPLMLRSSIRLGNHTLGLLTLKLSSSVSFSTLSAFTLSSSSSVGLCSCSDIHLAIMFSRAAATMFPAGCAHVAHAALHSPANAVPNFRRRPWYCWRWRTDRSTQTPILSRYHECCRPPISTSFKR